MQKWFGRIDLTLVLVTILAQCSHGWTFPGPLQQSCGHRNFQCESGQCIDNFLICDGSRDCEDGSDETSRICQTIECPSYAYQCAYGACVNANDRCNNREDCADGSDERHCGKPTPSNFTCKQNYFQCNSGQCIDNFLICDGIRDCADGSDETSKTCQNIGCPPYAYRCAYGACVNADAKCNNRDDCADGSDERHCGKPSPSNFTCKRNQFHCQSGTCIDAFFLCDGSRDCDDGSDETVSECGSFTCPGFAFRCDYGACIDKIGLCDGEKQCADGSDEKPERCGANPTPISTSTTTTTTKPPRIFGCKLPPQPENGRYILGCSPPCHPVPGNIVPMFSLLTFTCNSDLVLSGSKFLLCENGWSSAFPTCSAFPTFSECPPLVNPTRKIECKLNGRDIDCSKPMTPGTKAVVECNNFYTQADDSFYFGTVCESNGKWSRKVTSCIPKCGEVNYRGVPLIAHGTPAKYGKYPWHAGLYRPTDEEYNQICGGTLVSERVVITAAHCFWDDNLKKQVDYKQDKVTVGKYFRDWNKKSKYVQVSEINYVILHDKFRGLSHLYANDIALIMLKNEIHFTQAVRPICVDVNKVYTNYLTPEITGIVLGWGITETMEESDVLHTAAMPYVEFLSCQREVPESFGPFVTNDKFCAGYRNGTSVCPGDSGGGFACKFKDGKWYLVGIVSVGVAPDNFNRCNNNYYTTFTRISEHSDFIRKKI